MISEIHNLWRRVLGILMLSTILLDGCIQPSMCYYLLTEIKMLTVSGTSTSRMSMSKVQKELPRLLPNMTLIDSFTYLHTTPMSTLLLNSLPQRYVAICRNNIPSIHVRFRAVVRLLFAAFSQKPQLSDLLLCSDLKTDYSTSLLV